MPSGFTKGELAALRRLRTPAGVQRFLDKLPYHRANTAWSPRRVLRERTVHCLEGALFAAAALRVLGYPPLIVDLEAVHDDTDHVIAVFKKRGCWGAVAASNYNGLRYRVPVYRTLRELAMSYFEDYFDPRGRRTLRTYSQPVDLSRFDRFEWMTTERPVWFIPEYLLTIPHTRLLTPVMERETGNVGKLLLAAAKLGRTKR